MAKREWATEDLGPVITKYRCKKVLYEKITPFQKMEIVETESFGRMLFLDGIVQTTEGDEFIYHEMMTHVPLMVHPCPEQVLIIGGGDGGILREVLKHPTVRLVTMVEIDKDVVDFSVKFLPSICGKAFEDPRAQIVFDDGAKFVKETPLRYDVVIVDSPDPVGPAQVLFSKEFYSDIIRIMTEKGVMVRHAGATFLQEDVQAQTFNLVKSLFPFCALYLFAVPTYVGGFFSSVMGSLALDPLTVSEGKIERRSGFLEGKTRYYSPEIHAGSFRIPEYVKGNLKK